MKLVDAKTMKMLDNYTISTVGIPGPVLMEIAGRSCAILCCHLMREKGARSAFIMCGPGNNGGDGFVVARYLKNFAFDVTVGLFCAPSSLKGDALLMFNILRHFDVGLTDFANNFSEDKLEEALSSADVIVDALFGTGLIRPVEGVFVTAITMANRTGAIRVAVDIPSGVCSDTGRVLGVAFNAHYTVTFGTAKIGHFSYPGKKFCGQIEVADIGIPAKAIEDADGALLVEAKDAGRFFGDREEDAFKNSFGHLVFVGGFVGKAGAGLLGAMSAVRTGAGLVTIGTDAEAQRRLEGRMPELMVEAIADIQEDKVLVRKDALMRLLDGKACVCIGPGLGLRTGTEDVVRLCLESGIPAVLDADALNLVAENRLTLLPRKDIIITPHPGEAARLLTCKTAQVQANRVDAVRELARRFGVVACLKGAGTLVADPDGNLAINPTGSPALATAGSGDCLCGMIGALLARKVVPFDACYAAVYLHGLCGELAEKDLTEHGVSASDLISYIPKAIRTVVS
jgi:NAD(P)H-hydrate epimerase